MTRPLALVALLTLTLLTPAQPAVVRTMTHHQVTAEPRGASGYHRPIVSDSGNRILFGLNPAAEGKPVALAAIDFDGTNFTVLDEAAGTGPADLSADGKLIAYVSGPSSNEIRVTANGAAPRVAFKADATLNAVKVSGDGRTVVFLCARGGSIPDGAASKEFLRGVYAMNADGSDLRHVGSQASVAAVRNIKPDVVGYPNFTIDYAPSAIDVSHDGRQIAFGVWAGPSSVLIGCDGRGGGTHLIAERTPTPAAATQFASIALSSDGRVVAYHQAYSDELGVTGFDGKGEKAVMKTGEERERFGWGSSEPVYVTADGARVTYNGRHFDVAAGTSFTLMNTHQEGVLRYWEYERMSPDAAGRRFAYWPYTPRPMQLATMEINVPTADLRGAPKVSQVTVDPGAIPRQKDGADIAPSKVSARAQATPKPDLVSGSGFAGGLYDNTLGQGGSVGITNMFDDGKADTGRYPSYDVAAGDGVYTGRWLIAYKDAPTEPARTLRIEAQIQDDRKLFHAEVVEVGPFPVVDGRPTAPPVTIDVTPPPPPTVPPVTTTTTTGPFDLTGYWLSDAGAVNYLRQIGDKLYWSADGLPKVRNIFMATITGDVITGTWVDLPGGEIETNTGTLKLKIESNDKLTKISADPAYAGTTWTRTTKPATAK